MSLPAIQVQNDLIAHEGKCLTVCIGPQSGQVLATGGEDNSLHVWRLGRPTALMTLRDFKRPVTSVSIAPQEGHLACGTEGGGVRVVSLVQGKVVASFPTAHGAGVTCIAWHPRGERFLATGGKDCKVHLLDAATSAVVNTFTQEKASRTCTPPMGAPPAAPPAPITALCFSPPGTWLAVGDASGRVTVWDLKEGKPRGQWEGGGSHGGGGHRGAVTALLWHPTEFMLASAGADRCIRWWSLEDAADTGAAGAGRGVGREPAALSCTACDTGVIRALVLATSSSSSPAPTSHLGAGAAPSNNSKDQGAGSLVLCSVTDDHARLWELPSSPDRSAPPPASIDVLEGGWGSSGVAAAWVGRAGRKPGGSHVVELLIVASLHGPSLRAYSLETSKLVAREKGGVVVAVDHPPPPPPKLLPQPKPALAMPILPPPVLPPPHHPQPRAATTVIPSILSPTSTTTTSEYPPDWEEDESDGVGGGGGGNTPSSHHRNKQLHSTLSSPGVILAAASHEGKREGGGGGGVNDREGLTQSPINIDVQTPFPTQQRVITVSRKSDSGGGGGSADPPRKAAPPPTASYTIPTEDEIQLALQGCSPPFIPPLPLPLPQSTSSPPTLPHSTKPNLRSPSPIKPLGGIGKTSTPPSARAPGDFVPSTRDVPYKLSIQSFLPDNVTTSTGFGASRRGPLTATAVFEKQPTVHPPHSPTPSSSSSSSSLFNPSPPPSSVAVGVAVGGVGMDRQGGVGSSGGVEGGSDIVSSLKALGRGRESFLDSLRLRREMIQSSVSLWVKGDPKGALLQALSRSPPLPIPSSSSASASASASGPRYSSILLSDILSTLSGVSVEEDGGGVGLGGGVPSTPCVKVTSPAATGAGTGVFETLGLNLEGAMGVCECAREVIKVCSGGGGERGGKAAPPPPYTSSLLPLLTAIHTATAVLRAFSPVIRSVFMAAVGGGGGTSSSSHSSSTLSAILSNALDKGGSSRLDLVSEERARRALSLLVCLESVRGMVGRLVQDAVGAGGGGSGGVIKDVSAAHLAKSIHPTAKQFVVLHDAWARSLG